MATSDETPEGTAVTKREGRSDRAELEAEQPRLSRGTLVGRYVLLDVLGEGGMGVVYSAFDPELDRKVAIKFLQTRVGGSSGGEQAWLLREAQALARLAHPNVVAVYDVGSLSSDQVFVAMELVDGETLRSWLRSTPRSWRDVLPIMCAAGAGLAAAHAAGLVHRDFKPDNVIIGKDGRVRVMDFGLARLRPDEDGAPQHGSDLRIEGKSPLSDRLTIAGTVVGTPAYMAPEIYTGHAADARSDQFAFGVTLYEALFRARPYDKAELTAPASAPKPKTPPDTGVPAAIQRVVLRAIAVDPSARYASMEAMLAELAVDPARTRRRVLAGAAAVVVAAGITAGVFALRRDRTVELCTGADQRLAGVWDADAKRAVRASFDATKLAYAARSYAGLERALDAYAAEWTTTSVESCRATRIRGDQTEDVLSLRQGCLDLRLEELRAFVKVLGDANQGLVEKGEKSVAELEPIVRCSQVAALREPGRPAPEVRAKVLALSTQLAEAKAQVIAGRYLPALTLAQKTSDAAKQVGWDPVAGEAEGVRGGALLAVGNFEAAEQAFENAAWLGLSGRRDSLLEDGALSVAMVAASGLGKPAEAKIWLALADATAKRATADRRIDLRRHEIRGIVLAESGDLLGAVAAHQKAFETAQLEYGKDNPALHSDEVLFASTLAKAFEFAKAVPHFEHAIVLREAVVGSDHPDIAMMASNLGFAYRALHEDAKARAALDRALAIRERVYGKNSPLLVPTLDNLTDVLRQQGDLPAALATIERAQRLATLMPGKDHPVWHQVATDHAEVLALSGRAKEAHALYDDVLASEHKTSSTTLPVTERSRAELALAEHAWAEAAALAEHSVAGFEAAGGKDNPELWRPLAALARAQIGLGKPDLAAPLIDRAIAIGEKVALPAQDLDPIRALRVH